MCLFLDITALEHLNGNTLIKVYLKYWPKPQHWLLWEQWATAPRIQPYKTKKKGKKEKKRLCQNLAMKRSGWIVRHVGQEKYSDIGTEPLPLWSQRSYFRSLSQKVFWRPRDASIHPSTMAGRWMQWFPISFSLKAAWPRTGHHWTSHAGTELSKNNIPD